VRARDNPFVVQRAACLAYRLDGAAWEGLLERFTALGCRAALVGAEGHGKTTLLEELARRLRARGWQPRQVVLRRGERQLAPAERDRFLAALGPADLLLVDGAQELSPLAWRRLGHAARAAGGMLITSHREGLLPTLHVCRTTPELLAELMGELLRDAKPPPPGMPRVAELYARHRGNLRAALLEAYDWCAAR
jgi:hypothetical protein